MAARFSTAYVRAGRPRTTWWIQEVNINQEIKRHWREISAYLTTVLHTSGLSGVEAEEMAIFPGMEELSAMMYVNQYSTTARSMF